MNSDSIINRLKQEYQDLIISDYDLPVPHIGQNRVKAIILGADPTHILDGSPQKFNKVFDLDDEKSPYWRGINKNLDIIEGLSMDNIHIDNLCKNYFSKETSQNKYWIEIAREYWAPFHREKLDRLYPKNIPVLVTTEFILFAILNNQKYKNYAADIYSQELLFESNTNQLGRKVIALYRHYKYSLDKWPTYCKLISSQIGS